MQNLRPVYEAAKAADEKVRTIMADMVAAFSEGTEEGKQKALDLRATLDAAKGEADAANELYVSMRDAQGDPDAAARKFVPAGEKAEKAATSTITRAEFEAMTYEARYAFFKDGGTIVETAAE
jgi:hypothetical protein